MGVVVGEMECWDLECRWERSVIHLDELEVVRWMIRYVQFLT